NALTTGFLVTFLALELGAKPLSISVILALQSTVGLLRLATPALVNWFGSTRRTCLVMSLVSYGLIALLPLSPFVGHRVQGIDPVWVMIAILGAHQLFEYLGAVALWSWFGALVPSRVRGRFFARRNLWQMIVVTIVTPGSGWFVDQWKLAYPTEDAKLWGYAIVLALGAAALLASLVPLVGLPAIELPRRSEPVSSSRGWQWSSFVQPWLDRRFRPLLIFIAWFSFSNGLTQTAQNIFPRAVLELSLTTSLLMVTTMRVGQAAVSLPVGRLSDRWGNRMILIVSQACIALGLVFYAAASRESPVWLWGAWIVWIAFAGHNICLNNLMLRLAPSTGNTPHVAMYFVVSGVVLALSTLLGGWLLDAGQAQIAAGAWSIDRAEWFRANFLFGCILRLFGVAFLWQIVEPRRSR
ncbi:MAG: MFS transporter, partial [Planctomycetaceae bacterium]|nr:MFS transporter [Planctomycetaceae bacterium]